MTGAHVKAVDAERVGWVDAGKGLSIVLVVLYHATTWIGSAGYEVVQLEIFHRMLADIRMPVFFLLSGLFAAKSVHGTWRGLLENKISLFVWVYLLWSFLELPAKWLAMAQLTQKIDEGFLITQLLVVAAIPLRASGALWFIWALGVFFLIAKLTSRWPLVIQFGLASLVALGMRSAPGEFVSTFMALTGLGPRGCLYFYIFFLAGCYYRHLIVPAVNRAGTLGAASAIIGWALLWFFLDSFELLDNGAVSFLMAFVGCAAGLGLAVILSPLHGLKWIGARTLPIYVMHSTFLIVAATGFSLLSLNTDALGGVALILVASGLAVAGSLAVHRRRDLGYNWLFRQPTWLLNWIHKTKSPSKI